MSRRTVATMNDRALRRGWARTYVEPADAGALLIVTAQGCLTHIVRWGCDAQRSEWGGGGMYPRSFEMLCGIGIGGYSAFTIVDPADEMFGCHRCIALADHHGLPTYGLLPSTGCEATGGRRYRPRTLRMVDNWIDLVDHLDAAASAAPPIDVPVIRRRPSL